MYRVVVTVRARADAVAAFEGDTVTLHSVRHGAQNPVAP
jgi:hypothetical protein